MSEKYTYRGSTVYEDGEELSTIDIVDCLNELNDENRQLRTQLLLCQQSKNDDGRFQVWEVPPITVGRTISFSTNGDDV